MTKKNGDKNYVYLQCYKSGSARSIPEEEKKRHASSQKQSITIYFPWLNQSHTVPLRSPSYGVKKWNYTNLTKKRLASIIITN